MDFSRLYFRNAPSFKSLALIESIAQAAKIFEFTATLEDGSILLVSNFESIKDLLQDKSPDIVFKELLGCGTKPIDALAFLLVDKMEEGDDKSELMAKFKYEKVNGYLKGQFEYSCAATTAAFVIAVTRGSLPGSTMSSGKNPLPQFVKGMFANPPKDEATLSKALMSFDPKHVNLGNLFVPACLGGWPEEVANRLNLGVAGHKPMKACMMLSGFLISEDNKAKKFVTTLIALGQASDGGFYPGFHPANNSLKAKYPKFYVQALRALFDCLKGTKDAKYDLLERVGAFKSDIYVSKKTLDKVNQDYLAWDIEALAVQVGKPVKFEQYEVKELKRLPMIPFSDFPFQEEKEAATEKAEDEEEAQEVIVAGQGTGVSVEPKEEAEEALSSTTGGSAKSGGQGDQGTGKKGPKEGWIIEAPSKTKKK